MHDTQDLLFHFGPKGTKKSESQLSRRSLLVCPHILGHISISSTISAFEHESYQDTCSHTRIMSYPVSGHRGHSLPTQQTTAEKKGEVWLETIVFQQTGSLEGKRALAVNPADHKASDQLQPNIQEQAVLFQPHGLHESRCWAPVSKLFTIFISQKRCLLSDWHVITLSLASHAYHFLSGTWTHVVSPAECLTLHLSTHSIPGWPSGSVTCLIVVSQSVIARSFIFTYLFIFRQGLVI